MADLERSRDAFLSAADREALTSALGSFFAANATLFQCQGEDSDDEYVELTLDWFNKRPWDYYLAVEHAWPPGCSIEDDVPPRKYSNDGQISNDGFAMATDERRKKGYAYQRSCKNAGRVLGYSNFEYVDSDDCTGDCSLVTKITP